MDSLISSTWNTSSNQVWWQCNILNPGESGLLLIKSFSKLNASLYWRVMDANVFKNFLLWRAFSNVAFPVTLSSHRIRVREGQSAKKKWSYRSVSKKGGGAECVLTTGPWFYIYFEMPNCVVDERIFEDLIRHTCWKLIVLNTYKFS